MSDTAPGTEANPRPADRDADPEGGVTVEPGNIQHEAGEDETPGDAPEGQQPLQ